MNSSKAYIHGHRGCRGLWPENSLKAFETALDLNVDAIELDVVLTGSGDILVSHDPFMHHEICNHPDSAAVTETEEMSLNIFQMSTSQAQAFWFGLRSHPRFKEQKTYPCHKPTLAEAVDYVNALLLKKNKKTEELLWNIEIKSQQKWDNIYHPEPAEYVAAFLTYFKKLQLDSHCVIQSFDTRILEALHLQSPALRLVLLSEDTSKTTAQKLSELSFKPYGFSPNFELINEEVVNLCKSRAIELIVWTVNENDDLVKMRSLGVNHIITDYPQRAMDVYRK